MSDFTPALGVANAVLYEGYLLYPYTASTTKNRLRWQFGVVVPPSFADETETAVAQAELLLECGDDCEVDVRLRFLQVEERRVEAVAADRFVARESLVVDGVTHLTFAEAIERAVDARLRPSATGELVVPVSIDAASTEEPLRDSQGVVRGRMVRKHRALRGSMSIACASVPGAPALTKLRIRITNQSDVPRAASRDAMLGDALVSAHVMLRATNGRFLSVVDPPDEAAAATAALVQARLWPVLVGEPAGDDQHAALVFASAVILYDFPIVSAQTNADAFDATEIDELLSLSVLSLSDAEREEARATDPRTRAIVDRAEGLDAQEIARLHLGSLHRTAPTNIPDPFAAIDVPGLDCVYVGGTKITKGSIVRLRPKRRADVWDTFLAGKLATVTAVHQDLEDRFYVAVTVNDDPATEMHEWYGRAFFFDPDEVEPVDPAP